MDSSIQSSFGPLQGLLSQFLSGNKSSGKVSDKHDGSAKLNEAMEGSEVRSFLAASPRQALNQRILSSLSSVFASDQSSPIQNFAPTENFTPESVAVNVLNVISDTLSRFSRQNPDNEQLNDFFNQVRQGVEQGVSEAREILSGLGRLSGEVESDIGETLSAIQKGINQLEESVSNSGQEVSPIASSSTQTLGASYARSESGKIQIETQEGDLVSISFNKTQSSEILTYQSVQNQFVAQGFEHTTSASASLSFSVEGDLNQKELGAINKLLTRIDRVSDKFFDGNLRAAFNKASRLGIDAEQLAGFSVSLAFEETRSIVATSGQSVATVPALVPGSRPVVTEPEIESVTIPELDDAEAAAATNFVDELAGLLNDDAKSVLSEPEKTIGNLFNSILDNKIENNPLLKSLEQDANQLLESLVEQMSELVKLVE